MVPESYSLLKFSFQNSTFFLTDQRRAGSCDQYLHFYKKWETPESGMKMIYKPDGREGRLAYCYVTKPFEGSDDVSKMTQPHWWAAEAADCTDVKSLKENRAFNALVVSL